MPAPAMVEYEDASDEVRAVYDDILRTRESTTVTPYWKTIARHPLR